MKTSSAGLSLIKKWEGCHDLTSNRGKVTAYLCPADVPTIGFGSTRYADGRPVVYYPTPDIISLELAEELFSHEVANACEPAISRLVKVPLVQSQFDALSSLIFNIGAGAFGDSTLLRLLNLGDYQGAADQFLRWNKGGGRVLLGLMRRREEERAMFLTGAIVDQSLPILVVGEKGEDVIHLQQKLISKGQSIVDDGIFGNGTKNAVEAFQSSRNLVVDGVVGPSTWAELLK